MNIINKLAKKFVQNNIGDHHNYKIVINNINVLLGEIDDKLHKIQFLNIILEANNIHYEAHKLECTNPDKCEINFAYESIGYNLMQQLIRLGVKINEDTFTHEEKATTDAKLDQILKDLEEIKVGNQIIYEDLLKEFNDLKELYFLGKKRWYELFVGKSIEMGISGVVSETLSKKIVEDFTPIYKAMLEG